MKIYRRIVAFILLLLLGVGGITALFPLSAYAAVGMQGRWIDRATIEIQAVKISYDSLSDDGRIAIGEDSGRINEISDLLAQQATGKYTDDNIDDGNNTFHHPTPGCDTGSQSSELDAPGEGYKIDNNLISWRDLWLKISSPSSPIDCFGANSRSAAGNFQPADADNRKIWFELVNDEIKRVDGREGTFVKGEPIEGVDTYYSRENTCTDTRGVNRASYVRVLTDSEISEVEYESCLGIGQVTGITVKRGDTGGDNGTPGGEAGGVEVDSCEANNAAALAWLLCGALNVIDGAVTGLSDAAIGLLDTNPAYYTNDDLKTVWSYFKNLASFLLIIVGLVMIIGQAVTKE